MRDDCIYIYICVMRSNMVYIYHKHRLGYFFQILGYKISRRKFGDKIMTR